MSETLFFVSPGCIELILTSFSHAVLGWFQQSLIGEESSQNYSVSLGYIKGSGPGFNVVIVTNGAAGLYTYN